MALNLPNTITNGTARDATEVQGNFTAIKSFVDGLEDDIADNDAAQTVAVADAITTAGTNADTKITTHVSATGAHAASKVTFAPTGTVAGTTVQTAIAEVATDAKALTDALDTRLDTAESDIDDLETATAASAWTNWSLSNSWADFVGRQDAEYRKVGDEVQLRGVIQGGTTTDGTTIGNLPAGHRPPAADVFPIAGSGDISGGYIIVEAGGNVKVYGITASGALGLSGIRFSVTA